MPSPIPPSHTPTSKPNEKPWFERAFAADYLARYASRSDALARIEMPFVMDSLKLPARPLVLDLCCGAGRHARVLAMKIKRGRIIALDLSADLLRHATLQKKGRGAAPINYVRGDKRVLPLVSGQFDGVVNLFTSFGYFESDAEHLSVLKEVARILTPGGRFVIDFMNRAVTIEALVPRSEREQNGARIVEERRFDGESQRIIKTVWIEKLDSSGSGEAFNESVRAYSPEELQTLVNKAGLKVLSRHGDLTGAAFNAAKSPRCVLVCAKK